MCTFCTISLVSIRKSYFLLSFYSCFLGTHGLLWIFSPKRDTPPSSLNTVSFTIRGKHRCLPVSSYQRAPTGYKLCVSYTDRRKHTRFHKKAFLFKEMTFPAYYRETLIRNVQKDNICCVLMLCKIK